MDIALLIARLLLVLVFAAAGVAKLADRAGSRKAVADFGVPVPLAGPLGILLPPAELAVAAALISTATAWWGALGALGLLLLFAAGISVNLARGRKPDCHCFGQLHSAPAGWSTLARNGFFAAVAGFLVWQGRDGAGPGVFGWLGNLTAAQFLILTAAVVLLGLLAAQSWILLGLFRQNGRLLVRLDAIEKRLVEEGLMESPPSEEEEGLPIGDPAPAFKLNGLYGETYTLDSLRAPDKPVLLIFTDPDCGPCTALLPEIGRWQREHSDKMTITLVSRGGAQENRVKTAEHGVERVLLQGDWEVSEAYKVVGTPSAVLVWPDGTIGSSVAGGSETIASLVEHAANEPWRQQEGIPCPECGEIHDAPAAVSMGKKIGEPAPEITLPDLSGKSVELSDFRGSETLVLFWNPACGYCNQMLAVLRDWEANRPEGAPKLLVVSTGTVEANEAMGLRSPVVLDEGFGVGWAFGADGTPSAVLVDAEGDVASRLAVGAPAILELAGARPAEA